MKNIKKLSALVLALVMVLAISATAFAATNLTGGEAGEGGASAAIVGAEAVNIKKEIKAYNPDTGTINAPTITYSYTVTAGSDNKSITDANNAQANTKAGVLSGLKVNGTAGNSGTLSWSTANTLNAGASGVSNTKDLVLDFSAVVFTGPGVYRYAITETELTDAQYDAAGVTETNGSHVRYLDVYVKQSANFGTGSSADDWDVYGFTCFYNNESITDANKTTAAVKTNGFVSGTSDGTTAVSADSYYTFNVTVSKTVENDSTATGKFPFSVTFTNAKVSSNVLIASTPSGSVTNSAPAASGLTSGLTVTPAIATGGSVKYTGIPVGTAVAVSETNNVVGTTYLSTYNIDSAGAAGEKSIVYNASSNTATLAAGAFKTNDTTNHTIAFTNTFQAISPTGIAFRVAPYILMLAAGIFFFVLTRRRREETEAA